MESQKLTRTYADTGYPYTGFDVTFNHKTGWVSVGLPVDNRVSFDQAICRAEGLVKMLKDLKNEYEASTHN